ncbi:MAG: FAD-binding protein [Nitrospinae bacterium]|nr:FAD-binding protein [Nitrospinota bacterium]
MENSLIRDIQEICGKERVLSATEDLICYSFDATGLKALPDLVVFPDSTLQISQILKIANAKKIPVVPRGAGSGYVGGTVPIQRGIVLALAKMNKIIEIDEDNLLAVVQPGVINERLQQEVESRGLFYPPDPASMKIATIGGNVATCAGGPRAFKYGVTKDYVLGLQTVLPTGEIINIGVRTAKGVVGYDLTKLFVGSEGTLGVVAQITLKLLPKPESTRTVLSVFPNMNLATECVASIVRSRIIPATLEYMDRRAVECVKEYLGGGDIPEKTGAMLLIEVDGPETTVEREAKKIEDLCARGGAVKISSAVESRDREKLWAARRAISPSLRKISPTKINEDVTVPRTKIPEAIRMLERLEKKYSITIVNFGHAGDGNIHVNLMVDKADVDLMKRAHSALEEIFTEVLKMGGTISGEHGVGLSKSRFIEQEIGGPSMELQRRIKNAFDPNNIMNPGKIFWVYD